MAFGRSKVFYDFSSKNSWYTRNVNPWRSLRISLLPEVDADVVALKSKGGLNLLLVDGFSRLFEILFFAILAASIASLDRLPVGKGSDSETLYNNRRQVDFYILLLTTALGMSLVALAQDLFILFIGLELASLSIYVLVAFHKESSRY